MSTPTPQPPVKTTHYPIDKTEVVVRERDGRMRAALYMHSGKKCFTLEYESIDGYQPLTISEVVEERP